MDGKTVDLCLDFLPRIYQFPLLPPIAAVCQDPSGLVEPPPVKVATYRLLRERTATYQFVEILD